VTADQPPGRWHAAGEGPCHYLASSAKGAWAEIIRHEEIVDVDDALDLDLSLWGVETPRPTEEPRLARATLTGDRGTYPSCQEEIRRLRAGGAAGLVAPSAAVLSGVAEAHSVGHDGAFVVTLVPTETVVWFGAPVMLVALPAAQGHPDPSVLSDVRPL
jgi:hypothetical protein